MGCLGSLLQVFSWNRGGLGKGRQAHSPSRDNTLDHPQKLDKPVKANKVIQNRKELTSTCRAFNGKLLYGVKHRTDP